MPRAASRTPYSRRGSPATQQSKGPQRSGSNAQRKKSVSAGKTSSKGERLGRPPPLVTSDEDEATATACAQPATSLTAKPTEAGPQPPKAAASVLPALLMNPIIVNYEGTHMDLGRRSVASVVEEVPEMLKAIRRMCAALSTALPATGQATTTTTIAVDKEQPAPRLPSSVSPTAAGPPSGSPAVVFATRRTGSGTSPASRPAASLGSSTSGVALAATAASSSSSSPAAAAVAAVAAAAAAEVERIIEKIRAIEALLFPITSLQTAKPFALSVTTKAALSKRGRPGTAQPTAGAASKAGEPALAYYHTALLHIAPKTRKLAWKAFLQKSTGACLLLVGSLRCEAVMDHPALCVELICLLYNFLRNIPSTKTESSAEKEKKAFKLCEKVGLAKVLYAVMLRYHAELRSVDRKAATVEDSGAVGSREHAKLANGLVVEQFRCVRVLEAATLLYTELGKVNVKVCTMMRLSKDLRRALDAAQYVALGCVLRTLQNHCKLSDFECLAVTQVMRNSMSGPDETVKEALAKNRRGALRCLEAVSRSTSSYLGVLAHLLTALFVRARTALAAHELGLSAVSLCARVIDVLSTFLYTVLPKVRRVITATTATGSAVPTPKEGAADGVVSFTEPMWVALFKRKVEMALFWSVALLQRVCENDKRTNFTDELHQRNHIMRSLLLVLKSTGNDISHGDPGLPAGGDAADGQDGLHASAASRGRSGSHTAINGSFAAGAYDFENYSDKAGSGGGGDGDTCGDPDETPDSMNENEEMTLAVMAAMKVVLALNRCRSLEELTKGCGGLSGVVREVLKFRSESPEQWHRYYLMLSAMYGIRLLPARHGESAYTLDARLPDYMLEREEELRSTVPQPHGSQPVPTAVASAAPSPMALMDTTDADTPRSSQFATPRSASITCELIRRGSTTSVGAAHEDAELASMGSLGSRSHRRASVSPGQKTPSQAKGSFPRRPAGGDDEMAFSSPSSRGLSPAERVSPSYQASTTTTADHHYYSSSAPFAAGTHGSVDSIAARESPHGHPGQHHHPAPTTATTVTATYPPAVSLRPDLLLVDRHPDWLSPELLLSEAGGSDPALAPESVPPPGEEKAIPFPWRFTEPGPPPTNTIVGHSNEVGLALRLQPPSRVQRVALLKHHISRLRSLDESVTDADPSWQQRHRYSVVYERRDAVNTPPRDAATSADYDVSPGHSASKPPTFGSNFESGNLKRVVQVSQREYDMVLDWDTSSNGFTQWFCFSVADYEPEVTYRFNFLNMEKKGSSFNDGQRPLMLFVPPPGRASADTVRDWQRVGHNIFYFRNPYGRPDRDSLQGDLYPLPNSEPAVVGKGSAPKASQKSPASASRRQSTASGGAPAKRVSPAPMLASRGGAAASGTRAGAKAGSSLSPASRAHSRSSSVTRPPVASAGKSTTAPSRSPHAASPSPASRVATTARGSAARAAAAAAAVPDFSTDFHTLTFTVKMPSQRGGVVYLANCFPYTYSELRAHLTELEASRHGGAGKDPTGRYFAVQSLCSTLGGLPVPMITATAQRRPGDGSLYTAAEIRSRPVCVLTARIHPGETNSSWMMHGMLEALLRSHVPGNAGGVHPDHAHAANDAIEHLLRSFVFKIVPMLNPDGVALGNHRCSITGVDLNRDYMKPDAVKNPTVYAVHRYMQQVIDVEKRAVVLFADFHGHSKAKNFLMYGCTQALADALARKIAKDTKVTVEEQMLIAGSGAQPAEDGWSSPYSPHSPFSFSERSDVASSARSGQLKADGGGAEGSVPAKETAVAYEKLFPILMSHATPSFGLSQCSFSMQKAMRKTGRIIQYRKYGIRMSYTIEGTMVGGTGADFVCPWRYDGDAFPQSRDGGGTLETHYTQDAFSVLGHSFLSTLHLLIVIDGVVRLADTARAEAVPTELLRVAWEQVVSSGTGRSAPALPSCAVVCGAPAEPRPLAAGVHGPSPSSPLDPSGSGAAGRYCVATRPQRRTGPMVASSQQHTPVPEGPPLVHSDTMVPSPEGDSDCDESPAWPLTKHYQAAMRHLFSTAASRVADEGDNEEEEGGGDDDDSDGGAPRAAVKTKRRVALASAAPKLTGTAAGRKRKPSKQMSMPRPTFVGPVRPSRGAAVPFPQMAPEMAYFVPDTTDSEQAPSPHSQRLGTSAATAASGTTDVDYDSDDNAGDEGDAGEGSRSTNAPSPTGESVDGGAPPAEDILMSDEASAISISDDDDDEDEDDEDDDASDDGDDGDAILGRTGRLDDHLDNNGETHGEGEYNDDDGECTFVDHGSELEETDCDDYDDDADYGEMEPMPSNVF